MLYFLNVVENIFLMNILFNFEVEYTFDVAMKALSVY